MLVLVKSSLFP